MTPRWARVREPHISAYPTPVHFVAGELVTVGRHDDAYPGWVWTTTEDGTQGWAPAALLEPLEGTRARAREDYNARELDTRLGERVTVLHEQAGWCWLRDPRGEEGWVPAATLISTDV